MRPDDRAIDEDILEVCVFGELSEDSLPDTLLLPAGEALVDGIPVAKTCRKVTPRSACSRDVQDNLYELAIVESTTAGVAFFPR